MILAGVGLVLIWTRDPWVAAQFAPSRTILVPARIGGMERLYVLDSAAEKTVVTQQVSARLHPTGRIVQQSSGYFCQEPRQAKVFRAGEIHFAGRKLIYPEEVDSADLADLSAKLQHDLGGILGWDVLSNYVVGIDLAGGRVLASGRLTAAEAFERFGVSGPETELPLEHSGDLPSVRVRSGEHELHLLLDTGASKTTILDAAWQRMNKTVSPEAPLSVVQTIGGPLQVREEHLEDMWLGSLRLDHVTVQISMPTNCAEANTTAVDGVLGLDILSTYLVVIDGPARILYLARPPAGSKL
jgi:Aspartyl protease